MDRWGQHVVWERGKPPRWGNFSPSYGGEGPGPPGKTFHRESWGEEETYSRMKAEFFWKVLYGRDPPHLVYYGAKSTTAFEVKKHLEERDGVLKELKQHLERAQQIMKKQADGKRRDIQFAVGDHVYLKLRPYRQKSISQRRNEKLAPRYFGPYEVEEKVGAVAYRLKLPQKARIHPVFHVSQLRRVIGDHAVSSILPSTLTEDMEVIMEPLVLEGVRQGEDRKEVLIKWKGLPDYEATWEPYEMINTQFPDFHLEDKVGLWGGGIDAPPVHLGLVTPQPAQAGPVQVYRRRNKGQANPPQRGEFTVGPLGPLN